MKILFVLMCVCVAQIVNAQIEECPQADSMRKRGDRCCKTVICDKNHYFKPCDYPGGEDKCMPCPQNTLTKYAIDTSSYKQGNSSDICKSCTDFCVNKTEITLGDLNACKKTGDPYCVCNLNNGYCGEDPITCQQWPGKKEDIGKGEGLTQSSSIKLRTDFVEVCKPGFYKDKEGYGGCLKHRECSLEEEIIFKGNSTMNRQCGPLTQTTTPTKSTKIFGANNTSPSSDGTADTDKIPVIISSVVGCIILIVVIFVVVAIIYWRRRGRNNANPLHGDEEQNRGLSPNGQRMEPQLPNEQEGSEPLTNGQGMVDTAC